MDSRTVIKWLLAPFVGAVMLGLILAVASVPVLFVIWLTQTAKEGMWASSLLVGALIGLVIALARCGKDVLDVMWPDRRRV